MSSQIVPSNAPPRPQPRTDTIQHPTPRLQQRDMVQRSNRGRGFSPALSSAIQGRGRRVPYFSAPPREIQELERQEATAVLAQHLQRGLGISQQSTINSIALHTPAVSVPTGAGSMFERYNMANVPPILGSLPSIHLNRRPGQQQVRDQLHSGAGGDGHGGGSPSSSSNDSRDGSPRR